MKKILLCIVACLLMGDVWGQSRKIDSLMVRWKGSSESGRISLSNELSETYLRISVDSARFFAEQALDASLKAGDAAGRAFALRNLARTYELQGDYSRAMALLEQSQTIFRELKLETEVATNYNYTGIIFIRQSDFDQARELLEKSLAIFEGIADVGGQAKVINSFGVLNIYLGDLEAATRYYEQSFEYFTQVDDQPALAQVNANLGFVMSRQKRYDEGLKYYFTAVAGFEDQQDIAGLGGAYNGIGIIYEEQGFFEKALEFYHQALPKFEEIGDVMRESMTSNNIGVVYLDQEKYDEALAYLEKSLALSSQINRRDDMGRTLNNIGEAFEGKKQYRKALEYYRQARDLRQQLDNKGALAATYNDLGRVYTLLGEYGEAKAHLDQSLVLRKASGNRNGVRNTFQSLSLLYESLGDYRQSLDYYKKYIAIKDSLFNETKSRQIAELQTQYDTERKERELKTQQQQIELLKQKQKNDLILKTVLGSGAILLLALAVFIYYFQRKQNQKKQQLLEAQRALSRQLEEVNQMKSRFFANISHEFRTPLTLIRGPVEEMLNNRLDAGDQKKLKLVQRNASRLLKLVNQLLELSKIEAGKADLRTHLSDLVPFLKGQVFAFDSLARQEGITLRFDSREDSCFLHFDGEKMEQVITNLLSNAFKFSQKKGEITVRLEPGQIGGKPAALIQVSDTGSGIPKEQLPYIFDRFFQADTEAVADYEGSGIGLALVKELVELHHGQIRVKSTLGEGTEFSICLPMGKEHLRPEEIVPIARIKTEPAIAPVEPQPAEAGEAFGNSNGQPLLLIVEDNTDLRAYIAGAFAGKYALVEAVDGSDGLEKAIAHVPDLIISDVMMPKLNGIDLCKKLKNDTRTSHIPLILLTARSTQEDKLEGLESQADDYIGKPFSTRELVARVDNLVRARRQLQEKYKAGMFIKPKPVEVVSREEAFLKEMVNFLEKNIDDPGLGVEQLSREMGMSRVHLNRKLQALTELSPSQFIRQFRLHRAMDLLRHNAGNISEVAYAVGFSSPAYFSKCFADEFGYPPKEV